MKPKLSPPQARALNAMPFEITMWGGKPHGGWPGDFGGSSVDGLVHRGLARRDYVNGAAFVHRYTATKAGRETLAAL